MLAQLRRRLTYANVMATIAMFLALGGGAYAVTSLPKNSVGTKQLKRGAVTSPKLRNGAATATKIGNGAVATPKLRNGAITTPKLADAGVTGAKVAHNSLTAANIKLSTLPRAFQSFSAVLGANETKSVTIGNLTFAETADGTGACAGINLTTGSKAATVGKPDGMVLAVMANHTVGLTTPPGSGWFVIANVDGTDNLLATVGDKSLSGGKCLTWGGFGLIG